VFDDEGWEFRVEKWIKEREGDRKRYRDRENTMRVYLMKDIMCVKEWESKNVREERKTMFNWDTGDR